MERLVSELRSLEDGLRMGGGAAKIEKQHRDGKLTARERVARLLDPDAPMLEIGLLIAYDKYDGQAPGAGVVTCVGRIEGRPAVVVANDATVKAGAWWPETITKILRAQEIAIRNRTPIVYLVDSAGVNLPFQDGIFPGTYGAGRIFHYNCLMRRTLRIPQIAAVMGMCIAGGAYLPALSDAIYMVEGTSFMGLGGPNLVKGATGQVVDAESLGGARMHTQSSGVAHYRAKDDAHCLDMIRARFREMPAAASASKIEPRGQLQAVLPADHRLPYDAEEIVRLIFDAAGYLEFQPDFAPEMLCATASLGARPVGVIANRRGFLKTENSSDAVAIWLREDGDTANLAFATTQTLGVKGTTDWKEYSITLPLATGAKQLAFGVLLSGTGKAWADDLRLLVDGRPVAEGPPLETLPRR